MDAIQTLNKKISKRSSNAFGVGSNVVYLHSDNPLTISSYSNCKPYSGQVSSENVKVTFNLPNREMLILSTSIKESEIDRNSYDKHGGILYHLEPLTEDIANSILNLDLI